MNTTLTNDQITAGAAVLCDHGQPIGRNAAIEVADAMQAASPVHSPSYGPVHVVGDLVRNLLTLDQAAPIFTAFHVDIDGKRRCRAQQGITLSRERVIDGKWIDSTRKDLPLSYVAWAKPDERAAPSPQIAEKVELPPLPEPDGSASVPVDESRATFTEVDAWSEELVRQAQRDAIAASRRAAEACEHCNTERPLHLLNCPVAVKGMAEGKKKEAREPLRQLLIDLSNNAYFCGLHLSDDAKYAGYMRDAEAAEQGIIELFEKIATPAPASAGQPAPALPERELMHMFEADALQWLGTDHAISQTNFRRDDDGGYQYAATRRLFVFWKNSRAAQPAEVSSGQAGQVADAWHDAVFVECMKIETAYKADDPEGTVRALINWYYEEASGVSDGVKRLADNYMRLTCGTERAAAPADLTAAARDVLAERRRQVEQEGWTPARDDEYVDGQLASAAVAYAQAYTPYLIPCSWPWTAEWFKPADDRRNLVKAGALILAEVERLDRATHQPSTQKGGEA